MTAPQLAAQPTDRERVAEVLRQHLVLYGVDELAHCVLCGWVGDSDKQQSSVHYADALAPLLATIRAESAAEALGAAIREDRTTVAKLSPVERLTCFLVKAEDLVIRARTHTEETTT